MDQDTKCPVYFDESLGVYVPRRHAEITAILRDTALWSSVMGPGPIKLPPEQRFPLVGADPPRHSAERRLLSPAFLPPAVAAIEPRIEDLVDEWIGKIVDRHEADLIDDFAVPVPLIVLCWVLGAPAEDYPKLRPLAYTMAASLHNTDTSPEMLGYYGASFMDTGAYLAELFAARQKLIDEGQPLPDDLVSRLAVATIEGEPLSVEQAIWILTPQVSAGSMTTTYTIGNAIYRLLTNPDQLALLRAQPELIDACVEETLRIDTPIKGFCRTNTRPTQLGEFELETDTKILASWDNANHDPTVFPDPDRFDITRPMQQLKQHHGFGQGVHICLGAPLARLEVKLAVQKLLDRLPGLRLAGEPTPTAVSACTGFDHLPVAWD